MSFLQALGPLEEFLITLYVRTLGRGPDIAERHDWVFQLQRTHLALPVIEGFVTSPEFEARHTTNSEPVGNVAKLEAQSGQAIR